MSSATSKPRYIQLADQLREKIRSGELRVGDRLPSYNEMYRQFGAAPATMQRVCDVLEKEELIERCSGSGIYVAEQKRNLTGNIGLIFSRGYSKMRGHYPSQIMRGLYGTTDSHQWDFLLIGTDRNWNPKSFKNVDGLLLSGHRQHVNDAILAQKPTNMPCISLFNVAPKMTSIVVDDYGAAQLAMEYFYQKGHRRIACLIQGKSGGQVVKKRLAGYHDFLHGVGISVNPHWQRLQPANKNTSGSPEFLEWGRQQMNQWLQEDWHELGCTAILAQNDAVAVGAMQALSEAGIRVPEDVSIIGFDGTELCDYVTPQLTSIQLPLEEIGIKAMQLISHQIEMDICEEQIVMIPARIREGGSVRTL